MVQTAAAMSIQKVARGNAERQNTYSGEATGVQTGEPERPRISPRAMVTLPDAVRLPPPTTEQMAMEGQATKVQAAVRGKQARQKPKEPAGGILGGLAGLAGIKPLSEKLGEQPPPAQFQPLSEKLGEQLPGAPPLAQFQPVVPSPAVARAPAHAPAAPLPPTVPSGAPLPPRELLGSGLDGLQSMEEKLAARTDALLGNTAADREAELRAREEELRIREEELAMAKLNLDEERKRKAAKAAVPPIPCTRNDFSCVLL